MGPPAPVPPPAPMSLAVKRQLKVGFGVVGIILALVIAGVVAVNILNSYRGPEKQVETYLSLIADGHAQDANKMVDPGAPDSKRLLLTDEALGAATTRITSIDVEKPDVDSDDDTTCVTATFRLDGQARAHILLEQRGQGVRAARQLGDHGLRGQFPGQQGGAVLDRLRLSDYRRTGGAAQRRRRPLVRFL